MEPSVAKIGSNDENLRKLEPQQKQRLLTKKRVYHGGGVAIIEHKGN